MVALELEPVVEIITDGSDAFNVTDTVWEEVDDVHVGLGSLV